MDGFGFIRERLDIKILILFVLGRLPEPVSAHELTELCVFDPGIDYFDYAQCLGELEDTGHIVLTDGKYAITEKGAADGGIIESSLPYSVRLKAERRTKEAAEALRRGHMIRTRVEDASEDGAIVSLSLSDGVGEIAHIRLLAASPGQAAVIEKNFKSRAESVYNRLVEMLME